MKKRSEITKKRSEATKPEVESPPKTSAAERIVPLPLETNAKKKGTVHCTGCDEDIEIARIENYRPSDKTAECPECGCSITAAQMNEADRVVIDENGDDVLESEAIKIDGLTKQNAGGSSLDASVKNPDAKWCSECGSEWPIVRGKFWPNCGHSLAMRIDDPRKAKKMSPPGGLQSRTLNEIERRDAEDAKQKTSSVEQKKSSVDVQKEATTKNASPPAPRVNVEHVDDEKMKISVEWGKATFPVAPYQNFTVGSFFVSRTVSRDASVLDEGRKILEELRQLADDAFESQSEWYAQKLGLLTK